MAFRDRTKTSRGMWLAVLLAVVLAGLATGCGRGEEETPEAAVAPSPAVTKAAPVADELPVVSVLKYAPRTAAVAAAFTSVSSIYDEAITLARRFAPGGMDVTTLLDQAIADARRRRDLGDARSVPEILRQEGIEPDAPAGVFVGVDATLASLEQAAQAAEAPSAEQPAPDAAGEDVLDVDANEQAEPVAGPVEIASPDWAAVVTVSDRDAFEKMLLAEASAEGALAAEPAEVDAAGQTIVSYGERDALNYFFFDDKAVVGFSRAFVAQVAEQVAAPHAVNYGTDAMPASPDDIAVALVRLDMAPSIMEAGLPAVAEGSDSLGMLEAQLAMARQMRDASEGEDPMVVTVSSSDAKFEVMARIDYATHPKLRTVTGDPAPLRLARAYPAGTGALFALRLTPEFKQQIQDTWLNNLPQNLQQDPQMFQAILMLRQVLQLIGTEIAIGVTGQQEIAMPSMLPQTGSGASGGRMVVPKVVLMIDLAQQETLEGLLMLMPVQPGEPHNGVATKVAGFAGIEIHFAIFDKTLVAGTSREDLTAAIDGVRSGDGGMFAAMQPPLDPEADRFSLFVVQGRVYEELLAHWVSGDPALGEYLANASREVHSVVSVQEVIDDVLHGGVTFHLVPADVAGR